MDLGDEGSVLACMADFARDVKTGLQDRFLHTSWDTQIACLSTCFDYLTWEVVDGNRTDPTHADVAMESLIVLFGSSHDQDGGVHTEALINAGDARIEWQTFKHVLVRLKVAGTPLDKGYKPIFENEEEFENMRILAAIFMCLCLSTVCCEKGFSLMASIMSALRNCMNIVTLDCLMRIASNCPKFDHIGTDSDPVLLEICNEAFEHWEGTMNRFPGRAHGHQGRKKKEKTGESLSGYYQSLSKQGKEAGRLLDSSSDEDDETEGAGDEPPDDSGEESAGPDYTEVGDFECPQGWRVLDEPAENAADWDALKVSYMWKNKRLAHIWEPPHGWDTSSFNHQDTDANGNVTQFFLYSRARQKWSHSLKLEAYGVDGEWVIIEKDKGS